MRDGFYTDKHISTPSISPSPSQPLDSFSCLSSFSYSLSVEIVRCHLQTPDHRWNAYTNVKAFNFQIVPQNVIVVCALFGAQVSCYSTRWAENKVTFLIEFGAWEDVDLSLDFGKVVAVRRFSCWRPLQFWRNFLTQIHVFPCSKLQKKGTAVFSSLSSITL